MREGTTSKLTAADRPYGEFYDFYSVSPENLGSTLVFDIAHIEMLVLKLMTKFQFPIFIFLRVVTATEGYRTSFSH